MSVTKQIALIRFYGLFNILGLSLFILLKSWNPNRVSMTLSTVFARNSFQILWRNIANRWSIYFGKFHPETKFSMGWYKEEISEAAIQYWKTMPWKLIIIILAWTKIMIILSIIYWGVTLCWALCWVLHMPYFFRITLWVKWQLYFHFID